MKLTEIPMMKRSTSTAELEKRVEDLERLVHGIIALGGRAMIDKARKLAEIEIMPYATEEIEQDDLIKVIGTKRLETQQTLSNGQLKEYRRIIEESNNNNNH